MLITIRDNGEKGASRINGNDYIVTRHKYDKVRRFYSSDDEEDDMDENSIVVYGNPPEYEPAPPFIPNGSTLTELCPHPSARSMGPVTFPDFIQSIALRFENPRVRSARVAESRQFRSPLSHNECRMSSSMSFAQPGFFAQGPPAVHFIRNPQ